MTIEEILERITHLSECDIYDNFFINMNDAFEALRMALTVEERENILISMAATAINAINHPEVLDAS